MNCAIETTDLSTLEKQDTANTGGISIDMAKMKAAFHTLGCKTNQYETDAIRMQFKEAGFDLVPFTEEADVYLINTCVVTTEAERKSRQFLRRAREMNQDALVVAIGCQVVLGGAEPYADLLIDNDHKSETCQIVLSFLSERRNLPHQENDSAVFCEKPTYDELGSVAQQTDHRAYIKIEDGCNQFCSYCVVPLTRGRVRSRDRSQIIKEARALAKAGYKEIVLTGIHLCSYGTDLGLPTHAVMELALELAGINGIERIRLGSLEPYGITDRFIELAMQNPRLCPHFHLSLQSGSDRVLALMNRDYRKEDYRALVSSFRQAFDDPGITTDIIVGFPGETETDFAESLDFCREIAFSRIHIFRYSARSGTAAARMTDVVPDKEKTRRSRQMKELALTLSRRYHERQVGRVHAVLVEQQKEDGLYRGYTPNYVPVLFSSNQQPASGTIVPVIGLRAEDEFLLGTQT